MIDRELYKKQCQVVSSLIKKAKENYYSNVIQENKGNEKALFDTIGRLLHRKTEKYYPTTPSSGVLANRFADFFYDKIEAIRSDLSARHTSATNNCMDTQACNAKLTEFESMTEDQVKGLINSSCLLGPFLDHEVYANFRPISNLKFISKMIEKAVSLQLTNYLKRGEERAVKFLFSLFFPLFFSLLPNFSPFSLISLLRGLFYLLLHRSASFPHVLKEGKHTKHVCHVVISRSSHTTFRFCHISLKL